MFDPTKLTVKQARARLCELDLPGLMKLLDLEIAGKHRSSLVAEIGRNIDMVKTADEAEAEERVAPVRSEVYVVGAPSEQIVSAALWFRFPKEVRRCWERLNDGTYRKI